MALKLYTLSGSPFSWRVQLALEHKGIEYETVPLAGSEGEHRGPAHLARNPHGKVPVIDNDGFVLFESGVILEYLNERYPDAPRLFPEAVEDRAIARRIAHEIDVWYWPHALVLTMTLYFKPPDEWDVPALVSAADGTAAELAKLESYIDGDFLAGKLSAADFTLYPFMAHIARYELRKPDLGLSDRIGPKLRAWMGRIEALPYFEQTYPPHWR